MTVRKLAVIAGVSLAILVPILQQSMSLGLSQAAFADQGNETLRAEGYAFSIWGLIYLALVAYAVFQARAPETPALRRLGWPAALSTTATAAWIVAASANWMWATVAIIVVAAVAAIVGLLRASPLAQGRERMWAVWPVAMLAGWLTIAAPINLITVLTAMGLIGTDTAFSGALAGLGAVVLIGGAVALKSRSFVYPLPIAWGLAAVYVAERADKPTIAFVAAGAAAVMLAVAAFAARRRSA